MIWGLWNFVLTNSCTDLTWYITIMILGIDVGGTTVKFGTVSTNGEVTNKVSYDTHSMEKTGFVKTLSGAIGDYIKEYPEINKVGIGFPGMLSADRDGVVEMANIRTCKNESVVSVIEAANPVISVKIENDAKCAALGEFHFGKGEMDNFILIVLGTGVGSGVVIDKKLFIGARGNACEIGHIIIDRHETVEQRLGLNQIIKYAQDNLAKDPSINSTCRGQEITPKLIFDEAEKGDNFSKAVFEHVGRNLGEGLVAAIRLFDINKIILGGGITGAFDYFLPKLNETLTKNLPNYYLEDLEIIKATVHGEAGILGAGSLQMDANSKM